MGLRKDYMEISRSHFCFFMARRFTVESLAMGKHGEMHRGLLLLTGVP